MASFYIFPTPNTGLITIVRFEIVSGRRVAMTPDGHSYAYDYSDHVSDSYLVQGLK